MLQKPGLEHASTGIPDQCTACAASQGINRFRNTKFRGSLARVLQKVLQMGHHRGPSAGPKQLVT